MRDLKVLTVDDDAINLKLLEVMLKKIRQIPNHTPSQKWFGRPCRTRSSAR